MTQDTIVIIDLGSRENARLAREINDFGINSVICPHTITISELNAIPNVKGVILNGGPDHIVNGVELDVSTEIYNAPMSVLLANHKGDAPWPEADIARREALVSFLFFCGISVD